MLKYNIHQICSGTPCPVITLKSREICPASSFYVFTHCNMCKFNYQHAFYAEIINIFTVKNLLLPINYINLLPNTALLLIRYKI